MRAAVVSAATFVTMVGGDDEGRRGRTPVAGAPPPSLSCPCGEARLCRPLSPQPVFEREVVAYHSSDWFGSNGEIPQAPTPPPPQAPGPLTTAS